MKHENEDRLRGFWDNFKCNNIRIMVEAGSKKETATH